MATRIESPRTTTATTNETSSTRGSRVVPIATTPVTMSSPASGEPMEVTSPAATPPAGGGANGNTNTGNTAASTTDRDSSPTAEQNASSGSANMSAPPPAAAAVHQPKIVQTAFIHKLYNMLEDPNIQSLISWSEGGDSFVMSPSADFSKVLSQYFKHTNISSFVRQLNMYGFHKERDVFHTGSPDTTLWEFKHGNGNFKRGDLVGLREIKRRASRHALVHRENNYSKPTASLPGTPAEPVQMPSESTDPRMSNIERTIYDMSLRLQRSEESAHYMHVKNQAVMETLNRLLHFNQELSRTMLTLVPSDSLVYRDVLTLQAEMLRQSDMIRSMDDPQDAAYAGRQQYLGGLDNAPVSPRQMPQDDAKRANLTVPLARGHNPYRTMVPSGLAAARRPYGSISGSNPTAQSSPLRNAAPAPPPERHPLSNVELPPGGNIARRHTSADIREHGWPPQPPPFSNAATPAWPSSPSRAPPDEQRLRESLSQYSLQAASNQQTSSRPSTPPPPFSNGGGSDTFGGWSWNAANRDSKGGLGPKDSSAPPTRRGSMAHILNPSDTAERSDEDEDPRGEDDRKRKRR